MFLQKRPSLFTRGSWYSVYLSEPWCISSVPPNHHWWNGERLIGAISWSWLFHFSTPRNFPIDALVNWAICYTATKQMNKGPSIYSKTFAQNHEKLISLSLSGKCSPCLNPLPPVREDAVQWRSQEFSIRNWLGADPDIEDLGAKTPSAGSEESGGKKPSSKRFCNFFKERSFMHISAQIAIWSNNSSIKIFWKAV